MNISIVSKNSQQSNSSNRPMMSSDHKRMLSSETQKSLQIGNRFNYPHITFNNTISPKERNLNSMQNNEYHIDLNFKDDKMSAQRCKNIKIS